ncbi:DUF4278 domain-containing protein [Oscillatoria sp. FACHB-1407]|uniref:DUF4278 domain-containing protein n=1 Tax=Oscillatoria sp. FACHB-1407 TaxID=2692847 RepID=UPI001684F7F3|nr:DUF4278 domain-containing protein [Oscillatoria sp. FACHB-1407]MBD2460036.1 DUF4278 domain-containing protein [Oscillatoria sp. FACHB-1407]
MKLTYRGISYDYNPPQAQVGEVVAAGQYRGSGVRFRKAQKQLSQQPSLDLKYRGVAYTTGAPEPILAPVVVEPVAASAIASVDDRLRSLVINHHRNVKQREQVMLSRVAVQVGLPSQYAYQYWNPIQGKINTAVAGTYSRSHVAFS